MDENDKEEVKKLLEAMGKGLTDNYGTHAYPHHVVSAYYLGLKSACKLCGLSIRDVVDTFEPETISVEELIYE